MENKCHMYEQTSSMEAPEPKFETRNVPGGNADYSSYIT